MGVVEPPPLTLAVANVCEVMTFIYTLTKVMNDALIPISEQN